MPGTGGSSLASNRKTQKEQDLEKQLAESQRQAAAAKADRDAEPARPDFLSYFDPSGQLKQQFQLQAPGAVSFGGAGGDYSIDAAKIMQPDAVRAGAIQADQIKAPGAIKGQGVSYDPYKAGTAMKALTGRATDTGESPWLKMALGKQGIEEQAAMDNATEQAGSGAAFARSSLASRGGLSTGAGERVARDAARNLNASRSQAAREGALDRAELRTTDENNKLGLLSNAAGLENSMGLQNAGNALQAGMFGSNQNFQGQQFNANMALDTSKANAANNLTASTVNTANALDASKFNAGMDFNTQSANNDAAMKAAMFGATNRLDADKFNATGAFNADQFNTQTGIGVNQFNAGMNAAGTGLLNANNLDVYKTQMGVRGAEKSANAIENSGKRGIGK